LINAGCLRTTSTPQKKRVGDFALLYQPVLTRSNSRRHPLIHLNNIVERIGNFSNDSV